MPCFQARLVQAVPVVGASNEGHPGLRRDDDQKWIGLRRNDDQEQPGCAGMAKVLAPACAGMATV